MKITNISINKKNNKVTLSAQLILSAGKRHDVYFEVDSEFENYLSKNATPFVPLALPISMRKREDLIIDEDMSSLVLSKISKIMSILRSWRTGFTAISIRSKNSKKNVRRMKNVGCFFSGGVDSFYTYLKNRNKINYLIFVHGFDIPTKDLPLYRKVEKNIIQIATAENVKLLKVKTNLRETLEQYFDWDMAHEFALASVSCLLSNGFKEIYMSCGQTGKNAPHHYMTPELDKLWSTEMMKIKHYGCSADKISKLNFLTNFRIVMKTLRVCWVNAHGQYNCCECEKCFRNMLALYASNSLGKCQTFVKPINVNKLEKIRVSQYVLRYFVSVLKVLKKKKDKSDVRYALEKLIGSNMHPHIMQKFINKVRVFVAELDKTYNRHRLYWFLAKRSLA